MNVHRPLPVTQRHVWRLLFARISHSEVMALAFNFAFTVGFTILDQTYDMGAFPDYRTFMQAAGHEFQLNYPGFFYPHWILPLFKILDAFPLYAGYIIWSCINILGIWFAAHVFGGSPALVLLSYQMFYLIFYGNIVGLIAGSLAVMWIALHRGWWIVGGVAWLIACTKPQLGIPYKYSVDLLGRLHILSTVTVPFGFSHHSIYFPIDISQLD